MSCLQQLHGGQKHTKSLKNNYVQDMAANANLYMDLKKKHEEYKKAYNLMALHTSNEDFHKLKQINNDLREKLMQTKDELKHNWLIRYNEMKHTHENMGVSVKKLHDMLSDETKAWAFCNQKCLGCAKDREQAEDREEWQHGVCPRCLTSEWWMKHQKEDVKEELVFRGMPSM